MRLAGELVNRLFPSTAYRERCEPEMGAQTTSF